MFEQTFKNIDQVLRNDDGTDTPIDYIEQTSWVLFLRYLDDMEIEKSQAAQLRGEDYKHIIEKEFRWSTWAMPKNSEGKLDHQIALTGPDLIDFVNEKLFPYLGSFNIRVDDPDTLEFKIGEIFSELKNKIESGYSLRDIIDYVDSLSFQSSEDKHELSHLYENKIKNMGNAGRDGGQYYTPRPLIKAIIDIVDPKIGETIYDGAVGSAGFLCESYSHLLSNRDNLTTEDMKMIHESTLYGKEKGNLAYIIGMMNMILHGIESPNIIRTNTLNQNIQDIQEKDRHDVILANPPFGGGERKEVQQNFNIKSGETAYLFLQHFIKMLKAGGRAGIVIKNTFLSNGDAKELRKHLLESCNVHTILDLPSGVFVAGVKTVVLFFNKGLKTDKIWYYQLEPGRNLGKRNPLSDKDLAEFKELQQTKENTEKSWVFNTSDINPDTYDLSVKNPNSAKEVTLRAPDEILTEIEQLDAQTKDILGSLKDLL
tara:strand:+ start:2286 stop:3734 length:1449 start_codon:yes stop_codon:yes gene_type:complete